MSRILYWCRECACFVGGPRSTCSNCGHAHDRERPALEEPPHLRRRRKQAPLFPTTVRLKEAA